MFFNLLISPFCIKTTKFAINYVFIRMIASGTRSILVYSHWFLSAPLQLFDHTFKSQYLKVITHWLSSRFFLILYCYTRYEVFESKQTCLYLLQSIFVIPRIKTGACYSLVVVCCFLLFFCFFVILRGVRWGDVYIY